MKAPIVCAFIIVVTLVAVSQQDETFSDALSVYRANVNLSKPGCLKQTNVKPELIDKALDDGDFSEDKDFKCFLKCFLDYLKTFDENGQVIEENFKKNIGVKDEAIGNQLYQGCGTLKGTDPCDTAWQMCRCVYQSAQSALKKA